MGTNCCATCGAITEVFDDESLTIHSFACYCHQEKPVDMKASNPKDAIGCKKVPLRMVPGTALAHQALAHMDGDFKYGPRNWRTAGVRASIYVDAALRHIEDWYDGREEIPEDSVAHHLGHAIACLNIILDAKECGKLTDDRPVGGPVPAVFKRLSEAVGKMIEKYDGHQPPTPASLSPSLPPATGLQDEASGNELPGHSG